MIPGYAIYGPGPGRQNVRQGIKELLQDSPTDKCLNTIKSTKKNKPGMTFELFKELLDSIQAKFQLTYKLHDLGIDIFKISNQSDSIIEKLWKQILSEEGYDWLCWFLYEKGYAHGPEYFKASKLKASDGKGNEICESVEELYKYLVKNHYFLRNEISKNGKS